MNNKKSLKVTDIPKGINIVIKNEVQPAPEKQKKRRRKRIIKKDNLDLLKTSSAPSYTPPGNIRDKVIVGGAVPKTQQYRGSSIIGPTQSQLQQQLLTAPPPQQLLPPPPQLLQITAGDLATLAKGVPPQAQPQSRPITFNFQGGYNPMMPMEWGGGSGSIIREIQDYDIISSLPEDKQEEYQNIQIDEAINKQIEKSNIAQKLNLSEDELKKLKVETYTKSQGKQWGTKDSNALKDPREKYSGNEFYKQSYKNNIERKLKNAKLTQDERDELNRLLDLINRF